MNLNDAIREADNASQTQKPPASATPENAALPAVSSTDWLEALKQHVAAMKAREEKHRCDINDSQIKLDVTMKERMELENHIYKTQKRI